MIVGNIFIIDYITNGCLKFGCKYETAIEKSTRYYCFVVGR